MVLLESKACDISHHGLVKRKNEPELIGAVSRCRFWSLTLEIVLSRIVTRLSRDKRPGRLTLHKPDTGNDVSNLLQ